MFYVVCTSLDCVLGSVGCNITYIDFVNNVPFLIPHCTIVVHLQYGDGAHVGIVSVFRALSTFN